MASDELIKQFENAGAKLGFREILTDSHGEKWKVVQRVDNDTFIVQPLDKEDSLDKDIE